MRESVLDHQVIEFTTLWHQILDLDRKLGIDKLFPNFHQLTTTEISIIQMVFEKEDVILKDISHRLSLPKSTLTNTINRLEKKGYLCRAISKQDLRSYSLELTSKGLLAQKEHAEYEKLVFSGIMQALNTDEERYDLIRLLKTMIDNIEREGVEK